MEQMTILGLHMTRSLISFPGRLLQVLLVAHFAACDLFILTSMSHDRCAANCLPLHYDIMMSRRRFLSISFPGCALQVLLVIHFAGSEVSILTAMSYDRYVAICHPLHYEVIMNKTACGKLAAACWVLGGFFGGLYATGTFSLSFCGSRRVPQFFCEVPLLLKISCSKDHITINVSVAIGIFYGFFCLLAIVFSYIYIFNTVLRIPSVQGRSQALSTCFPHLMVVSTFPLTGAIAYLKPVPESPSLLDLLLSVLYAVLPPSLNPIIYSLRNR
ncbi:olfactory receptor 14K1-like [Manis pentadactyla]|uniref:olfactory receptor 14K1-like n=1 Tax=Manis pentadactyla TaxID=143292 RepID=UPI00255C284F|nr:olfactory receptor 14K1-like [Manis pentadactyla]